MLALAQYSKVELQSWRIIRELLLVEYDAIRSCKDLRPLGARHTDRSPNQRLLAPQRLINSQVEPAGRRCRDRRR